ncbi:MAG: signal peptidase [Frankiales bacterium]|nr:signal peptidase [Frankiales bacterium]
MQAARGAALRSPRALLVLVALLTVALDAATKALVVSHLEGKDSVRLLGGAVTLVVSRNSGAAFSFAQGMTIVFTAVAAGVIVYIARIMPRLRSRGWAVTLGLLLGGALGNLLDRLTRSPGFGRGWVVDFISVPHFASFNVADSGITVGAALAILLSFRGIEVDGTRRAPAGEQNQAD